MGDEAGAQPTGLVTFLFTDVEGSTRLWAAHTAVMERALARHDELVRAAIDSSGGYVFAIAGDSFSAAFASAEAAVAAAIGAQVALQSEAWEGLPDGLRVRMGLHLGTTQERAGNYFGPVVNLAARVMSAAWGGQILCTAAVAERVGVPMPSLGVHHLRDVEGTVALHQVIAPGVPADFPSPRTLDAAPTSLPAQRASFVGRGADVAAVRRLLFDRRLVTLTGPGGTGKTRLAIEIAGREQPHHPGGTFFADLASLEDGDHVAATVARSCLVPLDASQPPIDQLTDALASRNALVVLDNCEHLLDAVADVADRVLASCPDVVVLATSREPLELPGEHLYVVAPLDTGRGAEAAELFVERAAAAGGDALDVADPIVAELCRRLDGIPLAIELAAARARTSSPAETIERLDRQLDLLSGTRRRGPDRHQTLRATIAWSYQLLETRERGLFDRLSVFSGAFDLAAAASVARADEAEVADLLHDLVSKSMVDLRTGHDGRRRYRLLISLRAFADEQLRAQPDFADAIAAHTRHYLDRLAGIPTWHNVARDLSLELEADLDDLLVATDRAASAAELPRRGPLGPGPELRAAAARATEPLAYLLTNLGLFHEARRRCDAALATEFDGPLRGRLLVARAYLEASEDGTSDYVSYASEALQYLCPGDGVWSAAIAMTSIPEQMFLPERPAGVLEEALAQVDGDPSPGAEQDRATLLLYLGGTRMSMRRYDEASAIQLRSAEILRALEPTSIIRLWSASGAAMSLVMLGRMAHARDVLEGVTALADWTDWSADWFFARALVQAHEGAVDDAHETLRSIGVRFDNRDVSPMASTVIAGFGIVAHLRGDDDRARALFEPLTATRAPASTAVLYETIAAMEHWTAEQYSQRRLERVIEVSVRHEAAPRSEFFAHLRRLLREELTAT